MANLNYHELTMGEPRDSPARRQQFLIICSIMASAFVYSALTSGALQPVKSAVTTGAFPGGNFCFKAAERDYAASMGLGRTIAEEYGAVVAGASAGKPYRDDEATITTTTLPGDDDKKEERETKKKMTSKMYHIYLDNPMEVSGMYQRWMTGVLVSDAEKADFCDPLLAQNPHIEKLVAKNRHFSADEKNAREVFHETMYEMVDLPSVDSLVLQFPFTDGFISALIFSYKVRMVASVDEGAFYTCSLYEGRIIVSYSIFHSTIHSKQVLPVLRTMAKEQGVEGNVPVVISHCSKEQEMCTHFVPLVQGKDFLIGRPTTEEHIVALGPQSMFPSWEDMKVGARKVFPYFRRYIDMLP